MKKILTTLLIMASTITFGCTTGDGGFKSLDVKAFSTAIQDRNITILDSRTAQEYAEGHIDRAVNIDVMQPDFEKNALSQLDRNNTIAVYCRSGRRSKRAAEILARNGFSVIELDCGIICWTNAGNKIVK